MIERLRIELDGRTGLAVALGVLLVAAAIAGGFLLGRANVPSTAELDAAGRQAAADEYFAASVNGLLDGIAYGLEEGRIDGILAAQQDAGELGLAAGRNAAEKRTEVLLARNDDPAGGGEDEVSGAPVGPLEGSGEVLVVGDSLQVQTGPYLEEYLQGVPVVHNAVGGYNSFQIYDLFEESYDPSQSVIVFDAGTNDNPNYPEILAGNLEKVTQAVGPNRCLVVPTIHGLIVDGVGNAGKNEVVRSFAASRPGTQTPDWAGAVAAHPELMQADNLHPIDEGAQLRAQLIAEGVQACLGGAPSDLGLELGVDG